MRRFGITIAALVLGSCLAQAGEKGMMHCFAFTPIKEATQAEWNKFYELTSMWPQKYSGIKMVWVGKLRGPLSQYGTTDAEARKKLAAGESGVSGALTFTRREYGACFWFSGGPEQLKEYTANPFHKEWMSAYEKVRVAGTTTYDIIGQ